MLRARALFVATVVLTVLVGSGFALATSYSYTGYSVDAEDGAVEVVLGSVKAPNALRQSVERAYVNNRHAILKDIAQAQPTRAVKGIVVLREFTSVPDVKRLLSDNQLTASYVWFGREGAWGTATVRVTNNDLETAFNTFRSDLLEFAADERKRNPNVPSDDLTQQSAAAVDQFRVFAVQVSGPAIALDRVRSHSSVRLVDIEEHPDAKRLAGERKLALEFHYAPMRPDDL